MGFLVNPVAGIGGPLALKGSDDALEMARAVRAGAVPPAPARARRALRVLQQSLPGLEVIAAPGEMGASIAREAGFDPEVLPLELATPTTAKDTIAAARELADRHVDVLLFAGGDGTARDIAHAIGGVPMLGIPSGVKMRSAVFGTTPEAAGEAASRYLADPGRFGLLEAELVDATDDEPALESVLLGSALVPAVGGRLQAAKSSPPTAHEPALESLCASIAETMEPGRLYLLGPGTTTARIMRALGLEASLLGVDAVRDGAYAGADLDERTILELLEESDQATLILGVIGGQGFLLGRGNQQLSGEVIRRLGADNVVIVAGADKVLGLVPPVLHVDLGDDGNDPILDGYRPVLVAPGRSIMMRVSRG